ncbi:glutamate-5-semialdehyde dehydrogenase [candidate division FCPU426 bacterium]|nr:glutamate-5-semialdehyde dehydrogenase [candidate division FCPU426 bacterium]
MGCREELIKMALAGREATRLLAAAGTEVKNRALHSMADSLESNAGEILAANGKDVQAAKKNGVAAALLDRLTLHDKRIREMAKGLREIADLPDPVGEVEHEVIRPNGMRVGRMRVPLGVIGMVYEARPNVTADAAGLCLKAGNAVILRGGSEAAESNRAIGRLVSAGAQQAGLPAAAIQVVGTTERKAVEELLTLDSYLDCVIPRGGKAFLQWVAEKASVPVIRHGDGNCHVYIDAPSDLEMAEEIAFNAKVQRPGVCNAAEKLLVHQAVAAQLLPKLLARYAAAGVEIRGCRRVREIFPAAVPVVPEDWPTEYLDLIIAVRMVDDFAAALDHIAAYSSGHSEAIVTADYGHAERFLREVDAAAVLVNASTRLVDGGQFGLGAEIGISTQKLHARGPMGIRELTTTKFIVRGSGQIRV